MIETASPEGLVERDLRTADPGKWRSLLADYLTMTKPRIISLLLVTTFGAMMIADKGFPHPGIVLWTLIGGALSSGGAGAINHFLDRDIDVKMGRTRGRPVATGRVAPWQALTFGVTLGVASFVLMTLTVNLISAALALGGLLFYVFVYTSWLKRSTPHNIVIGGAAGSFPPLVGWAAVTGHLALPAWILFAIIFYWTPPHFWALSLLIRGDYARAGVPMLPVVSGVAETRRQILLYSLILVAMTTLLFATRTCGPVYLLLALALGGILVYDAVRLVRERTQRAARRLYLYSLLYLALLFAAMVVDHAVGMIH
ncbi:MAG TPA: heme o synthase [Thermomicrobiales bacterium]|nr:heme o synthase [Thermomicrobiales bacterium]